MKLYLIQLIQKNSSWFLTSVFSFFEEIIYSFLKWRQHTSLHQLWWKFLLNEGLKQLFQECSRLRAEVVPFVFWFIFSSRHSKWGNPNLRALSSTMIETLLRESTANEVTWSLNQWGDLGNGDGSLVFCVKSSIFHHKSLQIQLFISTEVLQQ